MHSIAVLSRLPQFWSRETSKVVVQSDSFVRKYAKPAPPCDTKRKNPKCRRAYVDIKPDPDPVCPKSCDRWKKKKPGILHRIKLKVIEGGTNFGTPFRLLQRKTEEDVSEKESPKKKPKALPPPVKPVYTLPAPRSAGVQVSVLGADTAIGQYVSLLLKQCPCIKKLRLYESKCPDGCTRNLASVTQDLQHINTNCLVQAFSCACFELERCLQNTDIVLMLESGFANVGMTFEQRFHSQAPLVKRYADAIANECPRAFVIVCATPIDCMVPLVAETLRETGWYDSRRLLGSLAVPEMRASTLAARTLGLEPRYTRVPCVGGTEGQALVPLFSKAVEFFDFAEHNACMLTNAVRSAPQVVTRSDGCCTRAAELSEAHALAGLVIKVAHSQLCLDVPRVTGFVETDACQLVSPAKFIANVVEIGASGIRQSLGLPLMNRLEVKLTDLALNDLSVKFAMVDDWCSKFYGLAGRSDAFQTHFFTPKEGLFDDCAYANIYLAIDCKLNNKGICQRYDFPRMSPLEVHLLGLALDQVKISVDMAHDWYNQTYNEEFQRGQYAMRTHFLCPLKNPSVEQCASFTL